MSVDSARFLRDSQPIWVAFLLDSITSYPRDKEQTKFELQWFRELNPNLPTTG